MRNGDGKGRLGRAMIVLAIVLFVLAGLGAAPREQGFQAAPTPTPEGAGRLAADTIQKAPPPDLVQQIDLALGGGEYPGCMDNPDTLEGPVLDWQPGPLELTDIAMIATCGWQAGERVTITVMDPQGKLSSTAAEAAPSRYVEGLYEAVFFYQPGVDRPEGKYRFTITAPSGTVKAKVTYNRPKGARLYVDAGDAFAPARGAAGGQHTLRAAGFLPGEPLRLFAFQSQGSQISFYGWQNFTADRLGRLTIAVDLPDIAKDGQLDYYLYGRETHTVPLERFDAWGFSKTDWFKMDLYCPGALSPRLSGSQNAAAAPGADLAVNYQPGFGARLTAKVPAGTQMRLFGYPKCIDGEFWWQVSLSQPPRFGWVAEGFMGKYLVEPVK